MPSWSRSASCAAPPQADGIAARRRHQPPPLHDLQPSYHVVSFFLATGASFPFLAVVLTLRAPALDAGESPLQPTVAPPSHAVRSRASRSHLGFANAEDRDDVATCPPPRRGTPPTLAFYANGPPSTDHSASPHPAEERHGVESSRHHAIRPFRTTGELFPMAKLLPFHLNSLDRSLHQLKPLPLAPERSLGAFRHRPEPCADREHARMAST